MPDWAKRPSQGAPLPRSRADAVRGDTQRIRQDLCDASTVEVRLTAEGDGTRVQLAHRDLPPEESRGHLSGWTHYLHRLERAGSGRNAGPDPGMPPVEPT